MFISLLLLLGGKFLVHLEEAGDDVGFSGASGEAVGFEDGGVIGAVGAAEFNRHCHLHDSFGEPGWRLWKTVVKAQGSGCRCRVLLRFSALCGFICANLWKTPSNALAILPKKLCPFDKTSTISLHGFHHRRCRLYFIAPTNGPRAAFLGLNVSFEHIQGRFCARKPRNWCFAHEYPTFLCARLLFGMFFITRPT